jgi:hypothetical protein
LDGDDGDEEPMDVGDGERGGEMGKEAQQQQQLPGSAAGMPPPPPPPPPPGPSSAAPSGSASGATASRPRCCNIIFGLAISHETSLKRETSNSLMIKSCSLFCNSG